jgi:sporulation protein YlmC with PRC-barrel domain
MHGKRRIHLECLLGKKVYDIDGKSAGRIEEIIAENRDGECVIRDYLLGGGRAWLERLSIASASGWAIRILGGRNSDSTHRVSWAQMDLSDADHPRVRCRREELAAV